MTDFRNQKIYSDGDGGIVIKTSQDITDIVKRNDYLREQDKARTGGTDDIHLIGSIPFTAVDKLNTMGIMRGFTILDDKAFRAWLNHPDQAVLKIYRGTV